MNFKHYIKKAIKMPPSVLIKKVWRKAADKIGFKLRKLIDFHSDTRTKADAGIIENSFVSVAAVDLSKIDVSVAGYISSMYMSHRFDLLGSGWADSSYHAAAPGIEMKKYSDFLSVEVIDKAGNWLENVVLAAHQGTAKKIWSHIKGAVAEYRSIDWQRDLKSGYRWSAKRYYKEQSIGSRAGADIKMPWELSRMQHLPQMALFAAMLGCRGGLSDRLTIEFMNQVIDFTSANPPRMGANWACTMDVGIRAANILVAYDLFCRNDEKKLIDESFRRLVSNTIYDHGLHIVNNLEYSDYLTSNHYFSDIAGLLFVAAYLKTTDETALWLAFAIQEFISEFRKQFYDDGTNFEASTSYHRLSGEIAVYCASLITGLKSEKIEALKHYDEKKLKIYPKLKPANEQEYRIENGSIVLPRWFFERLYKAGMFTADITKPTGEIPQIGDNDSGRFFRLSPAGSMMKTVDAVKKYKNLSGYARLAAPDEDYWDENILDHSPFVSAIAGFFDDEEFEKHARIYPLEKSFIKALIGNNSAAKSLFSKIETGGFEKWRGPNDTFYGSRDIAFSEANRLKIHKTTLLYECAGGHKASLTSRLKYKVYKDFGMYLYKSDRIYLAVFAGPNGQNGNGGHTHNDKLSFELNVDGKDIFVDAGTYLYTPLPERRNQFRSVKAHNVPVHGNREQNEWLEGPGGLFSMTDSTRCELLYFSINNLTIKLTYDKIIHVRSFSVEPRRIIIEDHSNFDFTVNLNDFKLYSNGYGKLING